MQHNHQAYNYLLLKRRNHIIVISSFTGFVTRWAQLERDNTSGAPALTPPPGFCVEFMLLNI
jgi:hypothetical protein